MAPRKTSPAAAAGRGARDNQRLRTRKDLLRAAARLMRERDTAPTLEDVAQEALVSRATAYRYFPNVEALLVEAPLDEELPRPEELFGGGDTQDVVERVDRAEAALHEMVYANQVQLRVLLASSLRAEKRAGRAGAGEPVRQNRRLGLIEAALEPARERLDPAGYERLCAALTLVFGTESMIVLTDVHPTGSDEARRIKSWVVRTLVRAALEEGTPPGGDAPAGT